MKRKTASVKTAGLPQQGSKTSRRGSFFFDASGTIDEEKEKNDDDDVFWDVSNNVLFCFVWLATLGMPVVAPGTAADTFPNLYRGAQGYG